MIVPIFGVGNTYWGWVLYAGGLIPDADGPVPGDNELVNKFCLSTYLHKPLYFVLVNIRNQ
jgi:hypothetical protein